jgi:hypothetical protein
MAARNLQGQEAEPQPRRSVLPGVMQTKLITGNELRAKTARRQAVMDIIETVSVQQCRRPFDPTIQIQDVELRATVQ